MAVTFTEREQKLMAMAWQCFAEQPKVDFEKLAGLVGMTNKGSACNAWASIRKKLAQLAAENGNSDVAATVTHRKRGKKQAAQSGIGEDEEEESPSKKSRGRSDNAAKSQAGTRKRAGSTDSGVEVKIEGNFNFDI